MQLRSRKLHLEAPIKSRVSAMKFTDNLLRYTRADHPLPTVLVAHDLVQSDSTRRVQKVTPARALCRISMLACLNAAHQQDGHAGRSDTKNMQSQLATFRVSPKRQFSMRSCCMMIYPAAWLHCVKSCQAFGSLSNLKHGTCMTEQSFGRITHSGSCQRAE